jgi:hypothetical protein
VPTADQLAEFDVRVWAGMNLMNDDEPARLGIEMTHRGCKGYSCSFSALPSSNVPVPRLLAVIDEHLMQCHPEAATSDTSAPPMVHRIVMFLGGGICDDCDKGIDKPGGCQRLTCACRCRAIGSEFQRTT